MSEDPQVAILSYHDVSPDPHPAFRRYSATVREFERQMRWLSRRSYTAIDLDAFIAACSARSQLPPRSVIITFDDGFRSCAEHAVPVLQAYGFTAVFYLVSFVVSIMTDENPLRSGGLGIIISLVLIGIASMTFVLDFAQIEEAVAAGAPKRFAWLSAFGILVGLIWLYLEILRLLSMLRGDD